MNYKTFLFLILWLLYNHYEIVLINVLLLKLFISFFNFKNKILMKKVAKKRNTRKSSSKNEEDDLVFRWKGTGTKRNSNVFLLF